MTATYDKIATQTLGSSAGSVTFSSIAATYTDLIIISNGSMNSDSGFYLRFNSDTSTLYSSTYMEGNGSSASSGRGSSSTFMNVGYAPNSAIFNSILQVFNYANTTTYKTVVSRCNTPASIAFAQVGVYRATPAAITSITLYPQTGSLNAGSTFTLYGIKAE
jgi:hypothetical protein